MCDCELFPKCLMFVVNDLGFFVSHRLPIAESSQKAGAIVHIAYGEVGHAEVSRLVDMGFVLHKVPIQRGGRNPLADVKSTFLLWRIFCEIRPDIVHLITIKPVLYGALAARLANVPSVVSAWAGLGFVFMGHNGIKSAFLRFCVVQLIRMAIGHPHQIMIFQNDDDRGLVIKISKAPLSQTRIIRGSGVDLNTFTIVPEPEGIPVVVMAARLLRDKGVFEFVEAARLLRGRGVKARFLLVGEPDLRNPSSIKPHEVVGWQAEGIVECLGHISDVASVYSKSHIVVLPSYREGLPKSLIEAAACGRAVVTSDVPGCRDAIRDRETGILVPPRDSFALANALQTLLIDPTARQAMGKSGRALAEQQFDIKTVISAHLKIYKELLERA